MYYMQNSNSCRSFLSAVKISEKSLDVVLQNETFFLLISVVVYFQIILQNVFSVNKICCSFTYCQLFPVEFFIQFIVSYSFAAVVEISSDSAFVQSYIVIIGAGRCQKVCGPWRVR